MAAARQTKAAAIDMQQLLTEIRGGDIRSVYLFEGEEENFKRESLLMLQRAALMEGMETLNLTQLTAPGEDEIMAAADILPFMGGRRMVIVRDYGGMPKGRGKAESEGSERPANTALIEYLAHAPGSAVIVFYVAGKLGGTNKLITTIESAGRRVSFERVKGDRLQPWVIRQFDALGKSCDKATAERLIFTCGDDSGILKAEIGKLAAYAGERQTITTEDIAAVATRTAECTVFEMTNALIDNRQAEAWSMMRDMLGAGGSRFQLLAMLLRQFRLMQQVKIFQYDKVPDYEWGKRMGLPAWQAEQYGRQASRFTARQVREGVNLCLETEYACKSGRMNEEGSLESVMLKLFAMRAR